MVFTFGCGELTGFEGTYVRQTGWQTEFEEVSSGAKFSTGFVNASPHWVFSLNEKALISENFDGAFDHIYLWSGNQCRITCSNSNLPTTSPTPTFPTKTPTSLEPTKFPTSDEPSYNPTTSPSISKPTNVPTISPLTSTPTVSPSLSPTIACMSFSASCSNSNFNGFYNFNGYTRKWSEESGGLFSISVLPDSSIAWAFETPNHSEILLSQRYQSDFTSIGQWTTYDRSTLMKQDDISCAFSCSGTLMPSSSPTTVLPTRMPVTKAPSGVPRFSLVLENHLVGGQSMTQSDQEAWKMP